MATTLAAIRPERRRARIGMDVVVRAPFNPPDAGTRRLADIGPGVDGMVPDGYAWIRLDSPRNDGCGTIVPLTHVIIPDPMDATDLRPVDPSASLGDMRELDSRLMGSLRAHLVPGCTVGSQYAHDSADAVFLLDAGLERLGAGERLGLDGVNDASVGNRVSYPIVRTPNGERFVWFGLWPID